MKKMLLAAAIVVGGLALVGDVTPSFAQGGGAGGDVSTPRRSVPRVGTEKRDDNVNAGRRMSSKHASHKKSKKSKRKTPASTTQGGSSSNPSMAPTGAPK